MEKEFIAKWTIRGSEMARILNLLDQLVTASRKEKGNVGYDIYRGDENTNVLILHERYVDQAAFEDHKRSPHYQDLVVKQIIPCLEDRDVNPVSKLF